MKRILLLLLLLLLSEQPIFYIIFNRIFHYYNQDQFVRSAIAVSAAQYTFSFTGTVQQFTIPYGVVGDTVQVDLSGASGGTDISIAAPGYGARVQADLHLPVGTVLNIYVGGMPSGYTGGWNGGGNAISGLGATGGGGASDIRINGVNLANRVAVAGGGGGYYSLAGCGTQKGGNAGGTSGASGSISTCPTCGTYAGGGGASQSSGGGVGSCSPSCPCGNTPSSGTLGIGGNAANFGGGGGGGYYGGGGGGYVSAGGGGSSYCSTAYCTSIGYSQGYQQNSHGYVTISFASYPSSRPSTQPVGRPSSQPSGQPVRFPSAKPSWQPSSKPSCQPASIPTSVPTIQPTGNPSMQPAGRPSSQPSHQPTSTPSRQPSSQPSQQPLVLPTTIPSIQPSSQPTCDPTMNSIHQYSFFFTGNVQQLTIPNNVIGDIIHVDLSGASGGTAGPNGAPGYGARVVSNFILSAGTVLNIYVGGRSAGAIGGWNGGGNAITGQSATGGGGASDIRINGMNLTNRIVVAGGGGGYYLGGNCGTQKGGNGGVTGTTGTISSCCSGFAEGGIGASQSSGGAFPGCSCSCGTVSTAGTLGIGGNGGDLGGGGGGGYYGGGGGGYGASGGGGSSVSLGTSTVFTAGYQHNSHGNVTISFSTQPSSRPTSQPSRQPTGRPSNQPSSQPTSKPSRQPSSKPSVQPSTIPTNPPTNQPSGNPSGKPSKQPSSQPTCDPTMNPTHQTTVFSSSTLPIPAAQYTFSFTGNVQ
jgi:hypothetical protein